MKLLKELKLNKMYLKLIKNNWLLLILFSAFLNAQNTIDFPIISGNDKATIIIDRNDAEVVAIASKMFTEDVFNVTGKTILNNQKNAQFQIIAGTLGKSKLIDQFVLKHHIDVSKIKDKWETYNIQVIDTPS